MANMLSFSTKAASHSLFGQLSKSEHCVRHLTATAKKSTIEAPALLGDIPQKPKRPPTAYNAFCSQIISGRRANNESLAVKDISKEASAKWKALDPREKKKFEKMVECERKVYDEKMKEYNSVMLKKVTLKDALKTLQSYLLQAKDERSQIKKTNAYALFITDVMNSKGVTMADAAKLWSELDATKKAEYKSRADEMNKRYKEEMRSWKAKYKMLNVH